MKNIFLVFILIPLFCTSQTIQIDSFSGIRFGASKDEAIQVAKSLGASLSSVNELEEWAYLRNLDFDGINSKAAYLKFVDNKFYEAIIEFQINETNYNDLYSRMKLALTNKYGYGKDFSWMDRSYYHVDGNEFKAILEKKGKLCHVWAKGKQVTSDDFIVMEIGADGVLRIVFQNHVFATVASQKHRQLRASNK